VIHAFWTKPQGVYAVLGFIAFLFMIVFKNLPEGAFVIAPSPLLASLMNTSLMNTSLGQDLKKNNLVPLNLISAKLAHFYKKKTYYSSRNSRLMFEKMLS
jgi:hypothetical protein